MKDKPVKLTKSVNRKIGKTVYHKYIITIPREILDRLGWDEKTNLIFEIDGKDLKIKRLTK